MIRLLASASLFGLGYGAARFLNDGKRVPRRDDRAWTLPKAPSLGARAAAKVTETVLALDPRFNRYMLGNAQVERLWTGARWAEGPVWFGDLGILVFSDIPNNRLLKYDVGSGRISILRQPSGYANGNTRDREGRLLTCCQDTRAVIRTEHDGTTTTIATEFEGARLNGPNDIVVKSDGTIWFTDSGYGVGSYYESRHQKDPELPRAVYRFDPSSGSLNVVCRDHLRPNGLAFAPDETRLYISDTGITDGLDKPSEIRVYEVREDGTLVNGSIFFDLKAEMPVARRTASYPSAGPLEGSEDWNEPAPGESRNGIGFFRYAVADGIKTDTDGNVWAGTGWGDPARDGVTVIAPDGMPIGRIHMPEVVANLAFGGPKRNRLFMAGSTSLYALYVNIAGA